MDSKSPEDIDVTKVEYGNPPPWLPAKVWDRELRLWACDCAERVLPAWETWAKEHAPEHLEAPRKAIEVARAYAIGEASDTDMGKAASDAAAAMAAAAARVAITTDATMAAAKAAKAAAASATDAVSWGAVDADAWAAAWSAADANAASASADAERQWQKKAFCERMDKVSPRAL